MLYLSCYFCTVVLLKKDVQLYLFDGEHGPSLALLCGVTFPVFVTCLQKSGYIFSFLFDDFVQNLKSSLYVL